MPTPLRNVRVPDEVWLPAMERSRLDGTNLTAVIVAHLRSYGAGMVPAGVQEAATGRSAAAASREPSAVMPESRSRQPDTEPAAPSCRHPSGTVADGVCGTCGAEID